MDCDQEGRKLMMVIILHLEWTMGTWARDSETGGGCCWGSDQLTCPQNCSQDCWGGILVLISSICHWLDLGSYNGSSVGSQWDYTIAQLPDQYRFLDVWDHFWPATPACDEFSLEEFSTIRCKPATSTSPSLFTPVLIEMNPSSEGLCSKPVSIS